MDIDFYVNSVIHFLDNWALAPGELRQSLFSIQWIMQWLISLYTYTLTSRIVIYAVDRAIHSLNSRGQLFIAT